MFVYDPQAQSPLTIDAAAVLPWGADVRASVVLRGAELDLRGLSMGATITAGGATVMTVTLPPGGVTYGAVSGLGSDGAPVSRVVWSGTAAWRPDDALNVTAWAETPARGRAEAVLETTAPRPDRPGASWTWNATARGWTAPVARPDDGQDYEWDEATGTWAAVGNG